MSAEVDVHALHPDHTRRIDDHEPDEPAHRPPRAWQIKLPGHSVPWIEKDRESQARLLAQLAGILRCVWVDNIHFGDFLQLALNLRQLHELANAPRSIETHVEVHNDRPPLPGDHGVNFPLGVAKAECFRSAPRQRVHVLSD